MFSTLLGFCIVFPPSFFPFIPSAATPFSFSYVFIFIFLLPLRSFYGGREGGQAHFSIFSFTFFFISYDRKNFLPFPSPCHTSSSTWFAFGQLN